MGALLIRGAVHGLQTVAARPKAVESCASSRQTVGQNKRRATDETHDGSGVFGFA